MKKLYGILGILAVFILPFFLPPPIVSSGWHSQYGVGDTITIDLAAWNTTPINRTIPGDQATSVTLIVDGTELAATPTKTSAQIARFSRVAESVSYTIDKTPAQTLGFNAATGAVRLPPGPHDISLRWLGSSTWSHRVTIVEL